MMERSAPLSMHIDMRIGDCYKNGLESFAALELLFTAPKIRTLCLSGYPDDVLIALHGLRRPSPLESLNLRVVPNRVQAVDVNLPEALFGGEAPYCRRLTFETSVWIHAPCWLLTGITHLTISASVAPHVLFGALQTAPQLEVLCIAHIPIGWLDTYLSGSVPPRPRAALPRLSLLSLHSTPCHLVTLSSLLDAPPTLRRQLFWSTGLIWDLNHLASVFTAMQALIPRDSAPDVDDGGLRVARLMGGRKRGSFEVRSRTGSSSAGAAAREDALFLLNISWDLFVPLQKLHPPESFSRLVSLCACLGSARVEHLAVAPETTIECADTAGECATDALEVVEQWKALLAVLPSVKTLHLHRRGPACLSVLRALSASAYLLPYLERVFVVQSIVRYAPAAVHSDGTGVAGSGSGSTVASREFVRANLGTELVNGVKERSGLEVLLVRCDADDKLLDTLRKRARVVICDGAEY